MNVRAHFESLTRELEALRDRVRDINVSQPHWLTDGEWKESVLRATLKRYLPANIEPVRGFVISTERGTGQIDIILYDNTKPVLFRDGDLIFITPDAVVGIVEVKSKIHDRAELRKALGSLADDAEIIRRADRNKRDFFVGLFSYQTNLGRSRFSDILEDLQNVTQGRRERIVGFVSLGCSDFSMYWDRDPETEAPGYDSWRSYELENLAAGYFVSNLIYSTSAESVDNNCSLWFPAASKELMKRESLRFRPA